MSRRDRDRGLSLIEVLVVVVVLGVVMTVISGVVAVILRTQGPLAAATDDSRSLRGAVTWLAQDVAGVPPTGFDFSPAASSGCGGDVGPSLVRLAWSETSTTTVNYVANYRFVDDGPTKAIQRYTCSGTGSGPYANRSVITVTAELASTAPVVTPVYDGSNVVGVSITVYSLDGNPIHIDAGSRNPAATLPPTTTSSSSSSSSSSSTLPCSVSSINLPASVANQGSGVKRLQNPFTINMTVSGSCGAMTLEFDRGDGTGAHTANFGGTAPNLTYTFASSNSEQWSESAHTITIRSDGSPLVPTYTLTVS